MNRDDVRAWVNPGAWDDPAAGEAAVEEILASGSSEEAEWVAICGGDRTEIEAAAGRDDVRAEESGPPAMLDLAAARSARVDAQAAHARSVLVAAALAALADGMSESECARRAGVTRMTVRAWRARAV